MIDDEKRDRACSRFELQPELLLDGSQERRAFGIWLIGGREVCRTWREFARTGKPLQVHVALSAEMSVIDHHPFGES